MVSKNWVYSMIHIEEQRCIDEWQLIHAVFGFCVLFLSAGLGFVVSYDLSELFQQNSAEIHSWLRTLARSAHGHLSLFGMIHICFGLTLGLAKTPPRALKIQSLGLTLGTAAMGLGLLLRGFTGPSSTFDALGILIGICLSAFFLALTSHVYFLFLQLHRRY